MTNLSRITGKIFGETATTTGDDPEIGQFGSALAGTYVGTGDVATIQSLPAWSNGFIDSVTPSTQFPPLPEMTGFGKVLSYQTAYMLQKGVAEWDSSTTYYTGDFCKGVGEGKLYVSKVDSNTNHAVTDGTYWEEFSSGAFRNIGEIVQSTIPLTDAGLHLLDGALLQYGSYQAFIDYIADLYDSGDYTAIFDTEANWQATVTLTGICDKFVYDSVNNTVRLPKYGNQIFTKTPTIASTVPVIGNGKTLGLTNGTSEQGIISSSSFGISASASVLNADVGATSSGSWSFGNNNGVGVVTDGTKSGLVADLSSITNYPLDCYYYIVIATSTKTQIQVDIDEIATDLNGKMDTDGTNAVSSVKFADGAWGGSALTVVDKTSSTAIGTYTYDLSSWLPNDNYSYEVHLYIRISQTSQVRRTILINGETFMSFDGVSSGTQWSGCTGEIIVDSTKILTLEVTETAVPSLTVIAYRYRRIGTNQ